MPHAAPAAPLTEPGIHDRLLTHAAATPGRPAIIVCRAGARGRARPRRVATYAELAGQVEALAAGLAARGWAPGDKTLFLVRPGIEFFVGFFALLRLGAPPVLIDPGMGRARLLECVRDCAPAGLVGIPRAHLATRFWPGAFRSLRLRVTLGGIWPRPWGGASWKAVLAAILFTTGSTGPAKGVEYTHAMLARQASLLSAALDIGVADRDCATYPGFSLYSVALGMTAVVPDMDPTRPGVVDPRHIVSVIQDYRCSCAFGSPALWRRVTRHALDRGVKLPTLRRAVMAGAPAPEEVHARLLQHIMPPDGETVSPYGATEALPVALFPGREALAETFAATREGRGVCLGRPVDGVEAAIIRLTDEPIAAWSEALRLPPGGIGEIAVAGRHITRHYHQRPDADRLAKIMESGRGEREAGNGERLMDGSRSPLPDSRASARIWHRMGDLGYLDRRGRLWFCGRKSHRVAAADGSVAYSLCCEAIVNQHPKVARCALARCRPDGGAGPVPAQGQGVAGLVVELAPGARPDEELRRELLELCGRHEPSRPIRRIAFFPGTLPTDIRHNAKINREWLSAWINGGK